MTAPPTAPGATHEHASKYVHGGGTVVVVPGDVAAWLFARGDLNRLRAGCRGADPRRDAVLLALAVAAHAHITGSAAGSRPAPDPEEAAPLEWMSSTQAAELLDVTDRAVRLACQVGRLPARQVAGRWRISRTALQDYQRRGNTP